jgi:hypothetical protein
MSEQSIYLVGCSASNFAGAASCGVSPHEVKYFFGQIDGDGVKLLLHRTRPPRGSLMVSFTDLIVADHSRSAQGGSISLMPG